MEDELHNERQSIINALNTLTNCDTQIFGAAISLLMSKEWKEINEAFDVGEQYAFSLAHLETADDPNVQLLANLIKEIRQTIDSLQNLNAITDEEIDQD